MIDTETNLPDGTENPISTDDISLNKTRSSRNKRTKVQISKEIHANIPVY